MLWLNPAAWIAALLVAAPVLVHLFVHRRAERLVFPTLRFITPSHLASMRRRMLDDVPLLAVRAAILVAGIAALAAPLVMTAARQREWNARVVRATVGTIAPRPDVGRIFQTRDFETADLRDGIRRAVAWLAAAPPARRELVVVSPFALASITAADLAEVPASVGLRFERIGALPETRTLADARVLASAGTQVSRDLIFDGARTRVREIPVSDRAAFPVDVDAPADAKPAIEAAIAAVLSQRVWAPPANRRAKLFIAGPVARPIESGADDRDAERVALQSWTAEAIARMSRDADLQTAAWGAAAGLRDPRFKRAPWRSIVDAADGAPLIAAAGSASELDVVTGASAYDVLTPLLLRSIVNGLAAVPDVRPAEVLTISDAQLAAWSRPAPPGALRLDRQSLQNVQDDRSWFWALALALLALEAWMRRARVSPGEAIVNRDKDVARVA